jgi:hypothetical protein
MGHLFRTIQVSQAVRGSASAPSASLPVDVQGDEIARATDKRYYQSSSGQTSMSCRSWPAAFAGAADTM